MLRDLSTPAGAIRARRRRRAGTGFTLIELAIVIAVMVLLATVVMVSRGVIESARISSAAQMVDTLRKAARTYSERRNGSASFANVTLATLQAQNLLPPTVETPWILEAQPTVVVCSAADNCPAVVDDNTFFMIRFLVPSPTSCLDLCGMLVRSVRAVSCGGAVSVGLTCNVAGNGNTPIVIVAR